MTLVEQYQEAIKSGLIIDDLNQQRIVLQLQTILDKINEQQNWLFWRNWRVVKGLYIYGPVGRGKTWLMDLFYRALPDTKKARYHFHHFMQMVDQALRENQGHRNPLDLIAANLAAKTHVLCMDEFLVQDVTQASVLVLLLKALFKRGIILVATSNTKPDDLYLNGINRARFLPAIALIHKHCDITSLLSVRDYRLGKKEAPVTFVTPLGPKAEAVLMNAFTKIESNISEAGELEIQHRQIPYVRCGVRAIWFDFAVICQIPRCQLDYLELASRFNVFFVSNMPVLGPDDTVPVLLFMYLVDVLYDKGRRLFLSAATEIEALYQTGPMSVSFERTKSRLVEMHSVDYLED